jgi:hypothetical protein
MPNLLITSARAGLWPVEEKNVGSSALVSTALPVARDRTDGKDSGWMSMSPGSTTASGTPAKTD